MLMARLSHLKLSGGPKMHLLSQRDLNTRHHRPWTLVLRVQSCTSSNTFPPTMYVRRVESIFTRQSQSLQVFADDLQPILPRSSPSHFPPGSQFITCLVFLFVFILARGRRQNRILGTIWTLGFP